jgi:hypothetical protein
MTYQESYSLALKLKEFVCLFNEKAYIYFIFTNESEFYLKIFDGEPPGNMSMDLQHEAFYINKLPMAVIRMDEERETMNFRDPNLQLIVDLNTNEVLHFDGEESTPIDMDKVRQSFKKLAG